MDERFDAGLGMSGTLSGDDIRESSIYQEGQHEFPKPYPECGWIRACSGGCDYRRRILAQAVANGIFSRYFSPDMADFIQLKIVFASISKLVMAELNGEPFSPELLMCAKCHLWRKIQSETNIPIKEIYVKNSLSK